MLFFSGVYFTIISTVVYKLGPEQKLTRAKTRQPERHPDGEFFC